MVSRPYGQSKKRSFGKIKYVDIVFELVDARLPLSSRNPMMDQIVQQKPRLVLLNKGDLADNDQNKNGNITFKRKGTKP